MAPGQEAVDDNLGIFFYLLENNDILSVVIRIVSYHFMIKLENFLKYLFS